MNCHVRPSVCLSHLFTMFLSSHHHEIFRSYYHWWTWSYKSQGQRARVKVIESKQILSRFKSLRTVTLFWIHSESEMKHKAWPFQGHPSNFKGTRADKLTTLNRIKRFRILIKVFVHRWLRNDVHILKWCRRGTLLFFKTIRQGYMVQKIDDFDPNLSFSGL